MIATTIGVLLLDILPHRAAELAAALAFFAGVRDCPGLGGVPYAQGA